MVRIRNLIEISGLNHCDDRTRDWRLETILVDKIQRFSQELLSVPNDVFLVAIIHLNIYRRGHGVNLSQSQYQ